MSTSSRDISADRFRRPLIRAAELADSADIAALLSELGYPSHTDAVHRRLDDVLRRPDYQVLVAEHEQIAGGMGAVHVYPAIQADAPGALITALVVRESLRGRGLGRLLVADLEQYAQRHGCDRIMVTTANHRSGAHGFYQGLGYEFNGRRYARRF